MDCPRINGRIVVPFGQQSIALLFNGAMDDQLVGIVRLAEGNDVACVRRRDYVIDAGHGLAHDHVTYIERWAHTPALYAENQSVVHTDVDK
jgi:hypothetical protein